MKEKELSFKKISPKMYEKVILELEKYPPYFSVAMPKYQDFLKRANTDKNLKFIVFYLSQKNLISYELNSQNGEIYNIKNNNELYTYFENKRQKHKEFFKKMISNFFVGLSTGVLSTLIITYLTGFLRL